MADIAEAIRELTGRAPSTAEVKRINEIARYFGWKQGDPLFDLVAVLDAESRLLSEKLKQAPEDIKASMDNMREVRETEIALCEKKISSVAAEVKSKMVDEVVPKVSERVASAASEQISKMSRSIGLERGMILMGITFFCLLVVFAIGVAVGKIPVYIDVVNKVLPDATLSETEILISRFIEEHMSMSFSVITIFMSIIVAAYFSIRYDDESDNFPNKMFWWVMYFCIGVGILTMYLSYSKYNLI